MAYCTGYSSSWASPVVNAVQGGDGGEGDGTLENTRRTGVAAYVFATLFAPGVLSPGESAPTGLNSGLISGAAEDQTAGVLEIGNTDSLSISDRFWRRGCRRLPRIRMMIDINANGR